MRLCRPGGPALLLHTSGGRPSGQRLLLLPVSLPLMSLPLKTCFHQLHFCTSTVNNPTCTASGQNAQESARLVRACRNVDAEGSGTGPATAASAKLSRRARQQIQPTPSQKSRRRDSVQEQFPEKHKLEDPQVLVAKSTTKATVRSVAPPQRRTTGRPRRQEEPRREPSGPLRCASNAQRRGQS